MHLILQFIIFVYKNIIFSIDNYITIFYTMVTRYSFLKKLVYEWRF